MPAAPASAGKNYKVNTMSKSNETVGFYKAAFAAWPVKQLGPKPTTEQLSAVHGLGLRPGKQALANAMALRDGGVSGAQIVMACGAPQLNRMRGLIADGHVKRDMGVGQNEQGHIVYKLTVTAKGKARIDRQAAAAEKATLAGDAPKATKPAKAKRKTARKAKGTVAAPAATDTAPVTDGVTSDAPSAPQGDAGTAATPQS